jgi:hypothetical protein
MSYIEAKVSFDLPDWFPPDRFEKSRTVKYPQGHAWAGSYSRTVYSNSAEDALFKLGICEINHFTNCIVEFDCKPEQLPKQIRVFEAKLKRFLNRYKESKDEQKSS